MRGNKTVASGILLDTSAYSHLRAGDTRVIELSAKADVILISVVTLGELEAGFRIGTRYRSNRQMLDEFIAEPFVQIVDITVDVATVYGEVFASLRKAGTPVPSNDIWIAACAIISRARLVTFDTDFRHIKNIDAQILKQR